MSQHSLRKTLETLNLPNWAAGGLTFAVILLLVAFVFATSAGATPAERVQMTYQLALVIAGLIGLPLAVWRSWTAHKQAETGQKQLEGLQRQIAIAESGAEADRLQKGAELLQADGMAVRTAGIAILREIAGSKSHRYQKEAIDVLTSFLRSRSEEEERAKNEKSTGAEDVSLVFRALEILRQRGSNVSYGSIFIRSASVVGCKFSEYDYLNAKFQSVSLFHCEVPSDSGAEFTSCRFDSCQIHLEAMQLTRYVDCSFYDCKLIGTISAAQLEQFKLVDCDLSQLKTLYSKIN